MAILHKSYLTSLGLQLTDEEFELLSDHMETTLQERVVEEILSYITPDQAHELAQLQYDNNDQAVQKWLVENVPDLQDIISDEIDILLGEIAQQSQQM